MEHTCQVYVMTSFATFTVKIPIIFYLSEEEFKSGRIPVTLGGDQMIKVSMDSTKLQRGAYSAYERFDHFSAIVGEFFHLTNYLLLSFH